MAVTIVQKANGSGIPGATLPSPVTIGNVLLVMTMVRDSAYVARIDLGTSGSVDTSFSDLVSVESPGLGRPHAIWIGAKVATSTQQSYHDVAYHNSRNDRITIWELAGASIADRTTLAVPHDDTHLRSFDAGDFPSVDSGYMVFAGIAYEPDGPYPGFTAPSGWTQDYDTSAGPHFWNGHIAGAGSDVPTAFSIPGNGYNELSTSAAFILFGESIAPVANFEGFPTVGRAPLAVSFTDLSSGDPTAWVWTFGDGETSTEQNPNHTYTRQGVYDVTLTVTNADGSDSTTRIAYITILTAPVLPRLRDRILLSIRASFNDDDLYNHALVIATGDKTVTHYGEASDTDPDSPTRIAAIGDRVFKLETDLITTQATADKAAKKAFLDHCLVTEDISLEAICNPALEGNDVIGVQELTFSKIQRNFRIQSFDIPLSSARQALKVGRVIDLQTQTISVNDDIVLVDYSEEIRSTNVTSVTLDVPVDTTDGDFMLIYAALGDNGGADTGISVSGFTSIPGTNKWKKRIAESEPATRTVTWTGARHAIVTLMVFRNVDQTSPIAAFKVSTNTGTRAAIPGLTIPSGEYHLIAAAKSRGITSYEWPDSWTDLSEANTGTDTSVNVSRDIVHKPRVGANPPTFNAPSTPARAHTAYQLALRKDIS